MTNIVEGLSREIERVTIIRGHYKDLRGMSNVIVEPQIVMMTADIERAQKAIGGGDIEEMAVALHALRGWEE